jgi:hypothetical protein
VDGRLLWRLGRSRRWRRDGGRPLQDGRGTWAFERGRPGLRKSRGPRSRRGRGAGSQKRRRRHGGPRPGRGGKAQRWCGGAREAGRCEVRRRCSGGGHWPRRRHVLGDALVLRVRLLEGVGQKPRRPFVRRLRRMRRGGHGHVRKQRLRQGAECLLRRRQAQMHLARTSGLCRRAAGRRGRACWHRRRGGHTRRGRLGEKAAARGRPRGKLWRGARRRRGTSDARGAREGARGHTARGQRDGRARRRKARGFGRRLAGWKQSAGGEGPGAAAGGGNGRRWHLRGGLGCARGAGQNALQRRRRAGPRCRCMGRCGWRARKGEVAGCPGVVGGHMGRRWRCEGPREATWRRRCRGRGRRRVRWPQLEAALGAGGGAPVQVQVPRQQRRRLPRSGGLVSAGRAVAQRGQLCPALQTLRHSPA